MVIPIYVSEINQQVVEWCATNFDSLKGVTISTNLPGVIAQNEKQIRQLTFSIGWDYQIGLMNGFIAGKITKFRYESLLKETGDFCNALERQVKK